MMKKILLFLLLAVFTLGISAQAPSKKCPVCGISIPKCQYKGKHPKKKPTTTTPAQQQPSKLAKQSAKPATSKPKPITVSRPTGTIEGHGYVDLGLSVKWATQNVGASSPSDYGGYYAWGETRTKDNYDWVTYFDSLDGKLDGRWGIYYRFGGKTSISPTSGHDTARENWGGTWRMPTVAEFDELCNKCDWTLTSQGGHKGYLVTSKTNGNSIFLPAAGWRDGTDLGRNNAGVRGGYWSSTLSSSVSYLALHLTFFMGGSYETYNDYRFIGQSVRPVTD